MPGPSAAVAALVLPRAKDLPPVPAQFWHCPEYGAELVGTMTNVLVGLSAAVFNFAPGLPGVRLIPDNSLRLWVTGLIFAGSGSLYTISPWGRLSGSHLNPSVTLAFAVQGKMHWHDALGYIVAQFVGGVAGAALVVLAWSPFTAQAGGGVTLPCPGHTIGEAFWAEVTMTFSYLLAIFFFVSKRTLLRWTPLMNWLVVSGLVWLGAGVSGTSLNPARSFGPALVSGTWHAQWVYLVAPPLGALLAAAAWHLAGMRKLLTAKLYHVEWYRSIFRNLHVPCK